MTKIRALERADLPSVARLFAHVWRGDAAAADPELERFFASTLLDHPWADPELPSYVATDGEEVVGFIGSNVRRVTFDGAPRRMVCSAHLVAHPRARGAAVGARLMKTLLSGPQDLTITDGATEDVRRMWEALGGHAVPLGAFSFVRVFRPASLGVGLLVDGGRLRTLRRAARSVSHGVDRIAERVTRSRLVPPIAQTAALPLTPEALVENAEDIVGPMRLRSSYDVPYVSWLFSELERVEQRGTLWADGIARGRLWAEQVRVAGAVVGWYVCHLRHDGFCRVLQFAARPRSSHAAFEQLAFRARLFGAAALYGRLEPLLVGPTTAGPCVYRPSDGRLLVHASHRELLDAIRAGDAHLTRLDGEWW